ncbi:contactin-associated protein-like 2 [Actinia tenebrosa]|uniref:Contactin-associated protein-like 2 n=1 Tax=Actinia tenebrosa TaxID=6105 RepID=A0A6P8J9K2_ACTTE|nr:contactin-associated protein-like 2 [Actinia tenebrosa]
MCRLLRLVVLTVVLNIFTVFGTEITLKGQEYLTYSLKGVSIPADKNFITFRFKTIHPSGLFMYSRGNSDYIQLELINGVLKYTLYLGGEEKTEIQAGKDLFNGVWHTVEVTRKGRKTMLKVDSHTPTTKLIPGSYDHLNLNTYIYIGGMSNIEKRDFGIRALQYRGCLADFQFDKIKLLTEAKESKELLVSTSPYHLVGKIPFRCELEDYRPVTFMTPESYVKVTLPKLPQDNDTFSTSFKFRTFYPQGLLFSRSAIKVKMNVRLHSGKLIYDVTAPNGSKAQIKLGSGLDDGEWHDVNATINPPKVQLTLDEFSRSGFLNISSLLLDFSNKSRMKIFAGKGGPNSKFRGFVGCMLNLKVDSHKIINKYMRKQRYSHGVDISKCATKNRCFPNPCKNRGICSQDWKKFYCDCSNTYFEGETCEKPIFKATCEDYKSLGLDRDAHCILSSGGSSAKDRYTALCNVTDPQRAYTVIRHNLDSGTHVNQGDFTIGMYVHKINYHAASMKQIIALIDLSEHCRQYIRFDCIKSRLLNSPNGPSHAFWVSRDGKKQNYWGGATPGSGKCACAMGKDGKGGNLCTNPSKFCNCDIRDNEWRMDDGYLEEKDLLPVTSVMFHEKSAKSKFVLGQLECWGKKQDVVTKTTVNKLLDNACYPVVEPSTPAPTTQKPTKSSGTTKKPCVPGHDCFDDGVNKTTLLPYHMWTNPKTSPSQTTNDNKRLVLRQDTSKKDSSLGIPAIVLIVCALIILLLLVMKFVLPRIVACVRTHSKRGEYIVPPSGTGYPGRLMPLVAKRSSGRNRQLTHSETPHIANEHGGTNASGGIKSYWV